MGERIPLTIADYDAEKGSVTIIFQEVGKTTKQLSTLGVGDKLLNFVGPLGKPSDIDTIERAIVIGGGLGTAIAYPQAKALHNRGASVDTIVGFKNKDYVFFEDELKACSDNLYIATDDGSYGEKGFVTDILKRLLDDGTKYEACIAIGPLIMMKVVSNLTKMYNLKTIVSMNPIMIDGTGMCGCCRVTVGGETRFACVDGPDFDGHLDDFDEAMRRQTIYRDMEAESLEKHECRLTRGIE
jgi:ferredoxin--NADP+ reductase